jgi:class 3 adenylate cyclase
VTQDHPPPETQEPTQESFSFGPTVTIFFSDIRGFTDYTDAHGDAEAYRMLQHHNGLVKEQIALYQGHIVKTLGDSYMVSFDAARNAITCAIAVQRQLAQYNSTQHGPKIEIGIGINMGEPIREGDDLFGSSVNLASRICAVAGAGRILVSEAVRYVATRLESADYIDRGYFEIKGFQEPQHLFEVDWSGLGAIRATQVAPPRRGQMPTEPANSPATPRSRKAMVIGGSVAVVLALLAGGVWMFSRGGGFPGVAATPTISAKAEAVAKAKEVLPTVGAAVANKLAEPSAKPVAAGSPRSAPAAVSAASPAAGQRVLSADDFDNPNQRKFNESRSGAERSSAPGPAVDYTWEYHYENGMLVSSIKPGPWPAGLARSNLGLVMPSTDRVQGDLAVEITARATQLSEQARYGIGIDHGGDDVLTFTVSPAETQYLAVYGRRLDSRQQLASGRSDAIHPGDQENHLRVEIQGGRVRFLINGEEVGQAQHPRPQSSPGSVGLLAVQVGTGTPPDVEVRFDAYRVYSLAP